MAWVLAIASVPFLATTALAGPDWCDDGSPPPNDFRFQQTGAQSYVSSKEWTRSITSGSLSVNGGAYTGDALGGVARGMTTATEHATRKGNGHKDRKGHSTSGH